MSFEDDVAVTRKHVHQVELAASPERAFEILHQPSAICSWWGATRAIVIAEQGGLWVAAWGENEDDPDYVTFATIKVFDPPRRLLLAGVKYYARANRLQFKAEMTMEFIVEPVSGGSLLKVIQDGFPSDPAADAFYAACEKGWGGTFESLRRFCITNYSKGAEAR